MRAQKKAIRAGPRWRSRLRPLPRGDTETVPFGRSPCETSEPSEGYTKTFGRCQGWSVSMRARVKGSFVRGHPEWKDRFGGDWADPRGQPGCRAGPSGLCYRWNPFWRSPDPTQALPLEGRRQGAGPPGRRYANNRFMNKRDHIDVEMPTSQTGCD